MALWLELIPKLHKSDRLDARYHQLDDWDNVTSFEAEGTRLTAHSDLLTSTSRLPPTLSHSSTHTASPTTTTPTTTTASTTTVAAVRGAAKSPASSGSTFVGQHQSADNDSTSSDVSSVSLSITVAVGSFLLFVNILVFVAVYYQKDRIRRERRRHKADMRTASAQHYRHDDVDGAVPRTDSLSSDVRSNLSLPYGYTVTDVIDYPATATRNARSNHRHHHQVAGAGVTLPRLSSPPAVVDAPAYGTVRSRAAVPRWSATSDQVEMATTTTTTTTSGGGLHTYSECVGHNGGLVLQKCPVLSSGTTGPNVHHGGSDIGGNGLTLDDSRKPSTVV